MSKAISVIVIILVIAVFAFGLYYFGYKKAGLKKGGFLPAALKTEGFAPVVDVGDATKNPLDNMPSVNPLEEAQNPFRDSYQNPFR